MATARESNVPMRTFAGAGCNAKNIVQTAKIVAPMKRLFTQLFFMIASFFEIDEMRE
jgi:hypothetical protein